MTTSEQNKYIKSFSKLAEKIKSNKVSTIELLKTAKILNKNGELTKAYKPVR